MKQFFDTRRSKNYSDPFTTREMGNDYDLSI